MFICKGTLRKKLSDQNLKSKTGSPYRIGMYLFDVEDQEGTWIWFKTFGDINEQLVEGEKYEINFSINTREYNGKYYTDILVKSIKQLVNDESSIVDEWQKEPDKNPNEPKYDSEPPKNINPFFPGGELKGASDLPF